MEPIRDQDLHTDTPPLSTPSPAVQHTPQGVPSGKADLTKRFVAMLLDGIFAAILSLVIGLVSSVLGGIVAAAYYVLRDGLDVDFMKQRSLGKKVMNLTVVRLDGKPMDLETSVKRNWMWAIGSLGSILISLSFVTWVLVPLVSFVALVIGIYEIYKVVSDSEGRRWGDEMAGTKVIETTK